ncbi:hypothetical protein [Falsiroseomonas sp.]|uniref:hypothetical protein n=1 Tax=Falsiroseomonas sp. TaxID=2870721 RepID=UPI003568E7DC
MERLKRRLDGLPALLGDCRRVRICGLPARGEMEGSLRLAGLRSLLAATGFPARIGEFGQPAGPAEAVIWLGGTTEALPRLCGQAPVLLWPAEAGTATLDRAAGLARPHWLLCQSFDEAPPRAGLRSIALPDPAHALWGLLDHHPLATEEDRVLDLSGERRMHAELPPPTGGAWKRAARWVALAGLPKAQADQIHRRWLLERWRRLLVAHTGLATDSVVCSIFAALLGRAVLPRSAAVEAYWRAWAPVILEGETRW